MTDGKHILNLPTTAQTPQLVGKATSESQMIEAHIKTNQTKNSETQF